MAVETNSLGPPWTIMKLLDWSRGFFSDKGIATPRFDAELLLSHVLGLERVQLYAQFDRPLDPTELGEYRALVKRRALGEPVAHLVGSRGFWTFEVEVDSNVLVPRPDTETLVEVALSVASNPRRVVDMGTGSGIVAIALALEWPDAEVTGVDVSPAALSVAQRNFERLVPRVHAVESDLFSQVDGSFDVIVSNPPYIADDDDEVSVEVRNYEPNIALFSGPGGLEIYERLIPDAWDRLNPQGWLAVEIGHRQAAPVAALFESVGFSHVQTRKDLGGKDRVVFGQRA